MAVDSCRTGREPGGTGVPVNGCNEIDSIVVAELYSETLACVGLAALFKMNLLSGWFSMRRPRDRISCAVVVGSASMVPNVTVVVYAECASPLSGMLFDIDQRMCYCL